MLLTNSGREVATMRSSVVLSAHSRGVETLIGLRAERLPDSDRKAACLLSGSIKADVHEDRLARSPRVAS